MKNKKLSLILIGVILISSLTIGTIGYFFANSIIKKESNENKIEINNDNLVNIHSSIDKFELAKNTFNLDAFINSNYVEYSKSLIEKNLFSYLSTCIYNYYPSVDKSLITIKIYYQINYNKLNIIANWKIKNNINGTNIYKDYYDKFYLIIDRKQNG